MDPDAACKMAMALSKGAIDMMKNGDLNGAAHALSEATEYIDALKQWVQRGGFKPKAHRQAALDYIRANKMFASLGGSLDMVDD